MRLIPLEPTIQRYAWGSPIAVPALFGWSSDGQPIAELWYGDHPRGPATAFAPDPRALDQLIAARPELGGPLGFQLKILSADAPLSLQCHPDADQSALGFAAEEAGGVPREAATRQYPDPGAKPEIVVALGRFEALAGVRTAAEIRAAAERLGVRSLASLLPAGDGQVAGFVAAVLGLDRARVAEAVGEAARAATDRAGDGWIGRLAARYPGDPAALAPLFLDHVELAAGEALELGARRLHAYLGGVALELTGPSDNVLRGGLTAKRVDRAALLAVADLRPSAIARLAPESTPGRLRYRSGGGLELDRVELTGPARDLAAADGARVALALRGDVTVRAGDEEHELGRGDALLIAAGLAVELDGRGVVVVAGARA